MFKKKLIGRRRGPSPPSMLRRFRRSSLLTARVSKAASTNITRKTIVPISRVSQLLKSSHVTRKYVTAEAMAPDKMILTDDDQSTVIF